MDELRVPTQMSWEIVWGVIKWPLLSIAVTILLYLILFYLIDKYNEKDR